jgi:hypothetical protein
VLAAHHIDEFAQQVVGPGVRRLEGADAAALEARRRRQRGARSAEPAVAADPVIGLRRPGKGHERQRKAQLPGQKRPARKAGRKEHQWGGPMMPARHGLELGVDHRGGADGAKAQRRADHAERRDPGVKEHQSSAIEGHHHKRRHRAPRLAAQPACLPLGKRLQRPLGVTKVKGGGEEAAHRQEIGDGEEHESREAGDPGHPEAQPDQQSETEAGQRREQDHRWCGMHQRPPGKADSARSSQPAKPLGVSAIGSR